MAEEASGNPSEMLGYFDDAMGQVEAWEGEVPKLQLALEQLRSAMADVPDVVRVVPAALDESLESAVADQEHLEEFVRDVAYEFLRLNGYEREDEVDEVLEADGDAIDVGPADRHAYLTEEAEGDAEALLGLLGDAGLLEPEWGAGLGPDDPEWDEVLALLGDAGEKMDQPTYSYAFYEALGVEGTLALGGVLDDIALHYEGNGEAQTGAELADPLITGFASYTHWVDAETREELLAWDAQGEGTRDLDRMSIGVLFSGDGHLYEPELLAEAAYAVAWSRIERGEELADLPEALVFRSLAENPDAAWYFTGVNEEHGDWLLTEALAFEDDMTRPYYEGALETWIGTSNQDDIIGLHELWAGMTWAHSRGTTLAEIDPLTIQAGSEGLTDEEREEFLGALASTGVGFVPYVGEIQSGVEVVTGHDYIAGEDVNRWIALAGLIPFGDVVKIVRKIFKLGRHADETMADVPRMTDPPDWRAAQQRLFRREQGKNTHQVEYNGKPTTAYRNTASESWGDEAEDLENVLRTFNRDQPLRPGTPEFDELIAAADSDEFVYAVLTDGTLLTVPSIIDGVEIAHGSLLRNADDSVLAAGTVHISGSNGNYVVSNLDNHSGHFFPGASTVDDIALPAFEQYGLRVDSVGELFGEW